MLRSWPMILAFALSWPAVAAAGLNPIEVENQLPGTDAWRLTNPDPGSRCAPCGSSAATEPEIEGYASRTSVAHGETLAIYVNTPEASYDLSIFRLGWYGGLGARLMLAVPARPGVEQVIPSPRVGDGLAECDWTDPYVFTIPTSWTSGVYLALLTAGTSGRQRYVEFVVRDESRAGLSLSIQRQYASSL